jgi:formamidopyrimidine-DNA glycosylase
MPELPEVEAAKRILDEHCTGRTIELVEIPNEDESRQQQSLPSFKSHCETPQPIADLHSLQRFLMEAPLQSL